MALTHTATTSIKSDSGKGVTEKTIFSADAEQNFSELVPAGQIVAKTVTVPVDRLVSFFVQSTQALSFKTNSVTAPAQTVALVANKSFAWNTSMVYTNPLTTAITEVVLDNSLGTADATVEGSFLYNG